MLNKTVYYPTGGGGGGYSRFQVTGMIKGIFLGLKFLILGFFFWEEKLLASIFVPRAQALAMAPRQLCYRRLCKQ